jgi:hypothetical protein
MTGCKTIDIRDVITRVEELEGELSFGQRAVVACRLGTRPEGVYQKS